MAVEPRGTLADLIEYNGAALAKGHVVLFVKCQNKLVFYTEIAKLTMFRHVRNSTHPFSANPF